MSPLKNSTGDENDPQLKSTIPPPQRRADVLPRPRLQASIVYTIGGARRQKFQSIAIKNLKLKVKKGLSIPLYKVYNNQHMNDNDFDDYMSDDVHSSDYDYPDESEHEDEVSSDYPESESSSEDESEDDSQRSTLDSESIMSSDNADESEHEDEVPQDATDNVDAQSTEIDEIDNDAQDATDKVDAQDAMDKVHDQSTEMELIDNDAQSTTDKVDSQDAIDKVLDQSAEVDEIDNEERFFQIKNELVQRIHTHWSEMKEQHLVITHELEDKLNDLFSTFRKGLVANGIEGKEMRRRCRRLYAELAALWPEGMIDLDDIRNAIIYSRGRNTFKDAIDKVADQSTEMDEIENEARFFQIKNELVQGIHAHWSELKEQRLVITHELEDKLNDAFSTFREGLVANGTEGKDMQRRRSLYTELAELWPEGMFDRVDMRIAICNSRGRNTLEDVIDKVPDQSTKMDGIDNDAQDPTDKV